MTGLNVDLTCPRTNKQCANWAMCDSQLERRLEGLPVFDDPTENEMFRGMELEPDPELPPEVIGVLAAHFCVDQRIDALHELTTTSVNRDASTIAETLAEGLAILRVFYKTRDLTD